MKEIYAQAHRVMIYAGESAEQSEDLLEWMMNPKQLAHRYSTATTSTNFTDYRVERALRCLLSRPWFRRTWILQEAYLATKAIFIVGSKAVDWSVISIQRLMELGYWQDPEIGVLPGVLEWTYRGQSDDITLLFALITTRGCFATDPRDKVFALLGLMSQPSELGFEADYNLTNTEVFILTAVQLFTSSNLLAILSHVDGPSSDSSLPSWIPSWSAVKERPLQAPYSRPGVWGFKKR
ncbi:hypothetical protein CC86DRAFT_469080 [Ophiobolus disseminans]|uniref:Heterokaryon incompatibility domain-containing protein n=1 Tax=Ophiobolus disseminans TaxID=1469910 RepID=A0A6A6ZRJ7_9PLEO|nr:hypothetical protein CC86DRAFT_469080 [Ophiobolus disseminans]